MYRVENNHLFWIIIINSDSYRSLDLVVQGMLFLFYEPEIEDAVNPEVAFSTMAELQEAVDKTKYGGSTYDCNSDWIPFQEYDEIYKGPIPQNTMVSLKLAEFQIERITSVSRPNLWDNRKL